MPTPGTHPPGRRHTHLEGDTPYRQIALPLQNVEVLCNQCHRVCDAHGSLGVVLVLNVLLCHVLQPLETQVWGVLVTLGDAVHEVHVRLHVLGKWEWGKGGGEESRGGVRVRSAGEESRGGVRVRSAGEESRGGARVRSAGEESRGGVRVRSAGEESRGGVRTTGFGSVYKVV